MYWKRLDAAEWPLLINVGFFTFLSFKPYLCGLKKSENNFYVELELETTMQFNPWHTVNYGDISGDLVNGIIEIPKGSRAKYELHKETGLLMLDRVLYSSVYYPANYGFIPQTYCDDGDPLDILILSQIEIQPLCIVPAKIIGVMRMLDQGEADDKIIAVCANDMSVAHINDISELPQHFLAEVRQFFEEYKTLEKKVVKIEEFQGAKLAKKIFQHAVNDYNEKIRPGLEG